MTSSPFLPTSAFRPAQPYRLLPFRFDRLDGAGKYVLTNDVGEYVCVSRDALVAFVRRELDPSDEVYRALKSRHFLAEHDSSVAFDLLALKYRSRLEGIAAFTGLHIFVVTLRCDLACQYCQVSRRGEDHGARYDMSVEHADKAVEMVFRSPSPTLKIEFQGGEPLLNFALVRGIVESARRANVIHGRDLQFVIASNLSRLTSDTIGFCKANDVHLSTSLDGPAALHDAQRPARGTSSHAAVEAGIHAARAALGDDRVSALMTTTPASLGQVEAIIDEYVRLGFHSVFLRNMSPYGFAARSLIRRYGAREWLDFYKRGLAHILRINAGGYEMREDFTSIVVQKILSPLSTTYVDLQSPAGLGIGGIVYNYDGAVYASDEGRMLAEMGDTSFRLGHLDSDSYDAMLTSESLLGTLSATMLEGAPMCTDCAYLPYCGADPVFHRATQGDSVGHKAFSEFCAKQLGVYRHVLDLLENDRAARDVLERWA